MAIVEIGAGRLRGLERDNGVTVFKGIPYAVAERFAPPRPAPGWTGVRDALEFGPQAPQVPGLLEQAFGMADWPLSEDCLALNVWAPAGGEGNPGGHPVLAWIHGGAFTNGTAAVPWYDGSHFATSGCVVVTLNYRLGALGFTHLADLDGERFAGSGNLGLLDQVAALDWIQHNIAAFGGDPARVTVFGESAGGASVLALMACPAAAGTFQGAIAQSPAFVQLRDRDEATDAAARLLGALGLGPTEAARIVDVPLDRLLAAQTETFTGPEVFTAFAPTPDGAVLPGPVTAALAAGASHDVPLVIGTNRDELYLFTALDGQSVSLDGAGLLAVARRYRPSDESAAALVEAYAAARPGATPGQLGASIAGDSIFWSPAIRLAEDRALVDAPTWMYRFDWPTPALGGLLGACHGVEIPFVFHALEARGADVFLGDGPERGPIAATVSSAWTTFAADGHPGWDRYDADRRATMRFDVASAVTDDPDGQLRRCWSP
jgi:para-nitrobenzyl esterase